MERERSSEWSGAGRGVSGGNLGGSSGPAGEPSSSERLTMRSRGGVVGKNWWARRWSRLLGDDALPDRLQRGRTLARAGQVFGLRIDPGEVCGEIRHPRTELHEARIALPVVSPGELDAIYDVFAGRALFTALLLTGELSPELESPFEATGHHLFPETWSEFERSCSCDDPADPCAHLAAVYYLAADRIDRDPFLLLRFRGCEREVLLQACRSRRSRLVGGRREDGRLNPGSTPGLKPESTPGPRSGSKPGPKRVPGSKSGPVSGSESGSESGREPGSEPGRESVSQTDAESDPESGLESGPERLLEGFWGDPEQIQSIRTSVRPPTGDGEEILSELGDPPGMTQNSLSESALREAYQQASDLALELAREAGFTASERSEGRDEPPRRS